MIYAAVAFTIVMLCSAGYGKIKQGNTVPLAGSAVALCIFAGLRDVSFGPDLLAYRNRFLHYVPFVSYAEIVAQYKKGTMKDALFYIIMKFFSDMGCSYQFFIAALTAFYIVTITILIAKNSEKPIISFMMFMSLSWLQFSFTGLRQSLAMGLCTIALILLLNDKKSIASIILILIAGFVHSSAWIFLIAPAVFRFGIKIEKIKFIQVTLISTAVSLLGGSIFRKVVAAIAWNDTLANYANSEISLNWTGFIIQLCFAMVSYVFYDSTVEKDSRYISLYSLMTIGLCFQAFSSVVAEMFRISMYFSIASICVYPAAIKTIKRDDYKSIAFYVSVMFLIYYFFKGEKFITYVPIIN